MTSLSARALLPVIDLAVEAGNWPQEADLEALVADAVGAVLAELKKDAAKSELSLVFTDDAAIRELNAHWRAKDQPTNVLSFPAFALTPAHPVPPVLGDIVIAQETVAREAALEMKSFEHHLTHLVVHGFLHLLGYDHETDEEADAMEALETRILATLGIADPYAE